MATKKNSDFINEPMGDKPVTDVAGIGPSYGMKLAQIGYVKASALYGRFLQLNKDESLFTQWLKDEAGIPLGPAKTAYNCLKAYAQKFL
ncbi:unnamed protein product [Haemonchus placei]|uniref:Barrier-to-autointegration factor 1 n=1 Tax=Haemonchus placei TaxID=6290 RepID=A0A0N4WYR7_HAEPC|nr:unnamed protein product [Haemonchus placei]